MYQDADFISLYDDDLIRALLAHDLPRVRCWAFHHLAATRPYAELDHAWLDHALRRSPEDAAEIYRADLDLELAHHHLDAASVHLDPAAASSLRAFVDLDHLIALAPDTHATFTRQTRAWLERDPDAYLAARLHEDRPALSACELAAWLIYAPHVRPKTLANRLLAADLATFQDAAFGLLHALGLRLAGSLRGEQRDREHAIARLITLMRHNIEPVHDLAPLSASTQTLLNAGQLPASLVDSSIQALSPQRSPALAVALRDALASAKKRPQHAATLRLVLAACAQRDLLFEATPFEDDPTCFVWRWHLTPAEQLPALLASTAALDDARMATLTDMIEEHARSISLCGVMDALLPLVLARPAFDVARLLAWPLSPDIKQPRYTLPDTTKSLHQLALAEPARWIDALKRAPRAHLTQLDLVFLSLSELQDPSWTAAQRMNTFDRLFDHAMTLPTNPKEYHPTELREELAVMLGHLPTLRDATERLRTAPDTERAYVDVEACALVAHEASALETLPPYVRTRLELPRLEARHRMVKHDDGTWQLLLRCAQCHAYAYQPLGRLILHSPHYIEAPDDHMIVAPAPRCPRCDALDAYVISRNELAAMHPAIKLEYKARASILDVREEPLACEPPDAPPLTIRRVNEALDYAQRCVERDPDDPARWTLLAEMHQIAMSYEQAVAALDHALRLKPDDISLTLRRIATLALLKRHAEVFASLTMIAQWLLRPDDPHGLRPQIARLFSQLVVLHARGKTLHIKTYAPSTIDDAIAVDALRYLERLEELLASHSLDALWLSEDPAPASGPLHKLLADTPRGTLVHAAPKAGRNDPCPCGSGKKFKKCHGAGAD